MWFAFGLVTLSGAAAFMGYRRYAANWTGTPRPGYEYRASRRSKSDKLGSVRIGVRTASSLDFECKRESPVDRFFKRIGLAREHQIGCSGFDDAIYLVSDDPRVRHCLHGSRELSNGILALFERSTRGDFRLRRLACRGGRVWLDYSVQGEHTEAFAHLDAVLPELQHVAKSLPARLHGQERDRDPLFLRSVVLLALSSGLAINGGVQLVRLWWPTSAFTVDLMQLWWIALAAGTGVVLAMGLAAVWLLRRSSRVHLVLAELLLVGAFGAVSSAYAELRDLNMELDRSATVVLSATVEDKNRTSSTSPRTLLSPAPARLDGRGRNPRRAGSEVAVRRRRAGRSAGRAPARRLAGHSLGRASGPCRQVISSAARCPA